MARKNRLKSRLSIGALRALDASLARVAPERLQQARERAAVGVERRWRVDAPRLIHRDILCLPVRHIREYLRFGVKYQGGEARVQFTGIDKRVPLHLFEGARYAGRKAPGAVVKIWRDSPPRTFERTFAIKGRGVRGGIFQRTPRGGVVDDLHGRLPIVLRKGPEMYRALVEGRHGDVRPDLIRIGRETFRSEVARLLKVRA